jgi:hypothetical protein
MNASQFSQITLIAEATSGDDNRRMRIMRMSSGTKVEILKERPNGSCPLNVDRRPITSTWMQSLPLGAVEMDAERTQMKA